MATVCEHGALTGLKAQQSGLIRPSHQILIDHRSCCLFM